MTLRNVNQTNEVTNGTGDKGYKGPCVTAVPSSSMGLIKLFVFSEVSNFIVKICFGIQTLSLGAILCKEKSN